MVTHIVSDMGGVLIQIEWQERISKLLGQSLALEDLHRLWVNAASTLAFETGQSSLGEFAQAFIQEFNLGISPQQFQHEFLEIVQAPLPDCATVLTALKSQFHLSLLSNTNPAHHAKLQAQFAFFEVFDQLFLSYQVGLMKPDPQIFCRVIEVLGVEPQQIAFFDDGKRNVEVARELGMQAFQVNSPGELQAMVQRLSPVDA